MLRLLIKHTSPTLRNPWSSGSGEEKTKQRCYSDITEGLRVLGLEAKFWNSNPDVASDSQGDYTFSFFFYKMG